MKGLNFGSTYSYSRDRTVEMYLWSVAQYFEPHFSRGRIIFTKIYLLLLIIDDTYDAYGTLGELHRHSRKVRMTNLFEELNNELAEEGRSYSVSFTKDMVLIFHRHSFIFQNSNNHLMFK